MLYQVSLGLVLVAINHRAIQVALPTLTHVFRADLSFIQWILLVYDLAVIGLVLTLGRLGDLFGRKWIYILGFLIFVAGSAFCGLAQTSAQLITARVFQGIGRRHHDLRLERERTHPEQIEAPESWSAAPRQFLDAFGFTAHFLNLFALLAILCSALRGGRKD